MTSPTARVNPVPTVVFIGSSGAEVSYRPDFAGSAATLDDLMVTWGRTSYLEHHDAQAARFAVAQHDPAFSALSETDWRGMRVQLRWSVTIDGVTTSRTFFRGRITDTDLVARSPHPQTGASRGSVLEFTATGKLTDLGNRLTGTESWPAESGAARMDRIRAAAGSTVAAIEYRPYWAGGPFAARSVDRTDVLSLLRSMYDSSGADRMTYDPHTDVVSWAQRRQISMGAGFRKVATLMNDTEFGQGVQARVMMPTAKYPMLNADELTADEPLTRGIESRTTRVDYSWTETGGVARSGVLYDPGSEADRGVIGLKLSTELAAGDWALQAAGDWLDILWREGSKYVPPPMTYRADRFGGFPSLAHALLLIGGAEQTGEAHAAGQASAVFIAGTPWAPLGQRATFGVIGGTIRYADGGWRPTFYGQPTWHTDTSEQRPVRCGELTSGIGGTNRFTLGQLSRALTFADLRHIAPN